MQTPSDSPVTVQLYPRGYLESEVRTPTGYAGWRWLQCTDIPNEYRVLLPPNVARCYAKLLEVEKLTLTTHHRSSADWEYIADLHHIRERLVKRCCSLGGFRPGRQSFKRRSVIAPPDFTLKHLERWERDQSIFGFAKPRKHHASPFKKLHPAAHKPSYSTNTSPGRLSATTKCTPSPSRPTRPVTTGCAPNCATAPKEGPATSCYSECLYIFFRCPQHCPVGCCKNQTQPHTVIPTPKDSHPVADVLLARVVPKQGSCCQRCNAPDAVPDKHVLSSPLPDVHRASTLDQVIVDGNATTAAALHDSPPVPPAVQLPTPEGTGPTLQKPLPSSSPKDVSPVSDKKKRPEEGREKLEHPFPSVPNSPNAPEFNRRKKETKVLVDKETQTSIRIDQQWNPVMCLPPGVASTPTVTIERKGKERRTTIEERQQKYLFHSSPTRGRSSSNGSDRTFALGETDSPTGAGQIPRSQYIQTMESSSESPEEEDLPKTPPTSSRSLGKRQETRPEMMQKSVRFGPRSPTKSNQTTNRPAQLERKPAIRRKVPKIRITLPTPRESSNSESETHVRKSGELLVPTTFNNKLNFSLSV